MAHSKVIAKDDHGNKVVAYRYEDDGRVYLDIATDGRCVLSPRFARALAKWLTEYAGRESG